MMMKKVMPKEMMLKKLMRITMVAVRFEYLCEGESRRIEEDYSHHYGRHPQNKESRLYRYYY
jgi:hypothetical protein